MSHSLYSTEVAARSCMERIPPKKTLKKTNTTLDIYIGSAMVIARGLVIQSIIEYFSLKQKIVTEQVFQKISVP